MQNIMHFRNSLATATKWSTSSTRPENDQRLKGNIVKTQLSAWYVLHRLLKERWKEVFSVWSEEIEAIDVKLRKYREFLQIIFDNIKDEIRDREKKGAIFRACPSCHFLSQGTLERV